jgi:hypothetical protein
MRETVVNTEFTIALMYLNLCPAIKAVFLNRPALASVIPGHERFSWNLSF